MAHDVAFVSEEVCRKLVTEADAFAAVEATFAAMAAQPPPGTSATSATVATWTRMDPKSPSGSARR